MMRRSAVTLFVRASTPLLKPAPTVFRPDFAQGKERMEYDQPAKWHRFREPLYWLTDQEREEYTEEPFVGVDHLYEAHLGSKERPVVVEQMGLHGNDIVVGCLGGCHPDATDAVPVYQFVPPNTLTVCADCGLHFVAKCNEQVTFFPDGTQPWEKVPFEQVEPALQKHLRYGSPMLQ
eukprot:NODE_4558_length_792_cov_87.920592_g4217_i0.p3 GENE.NODE_4558_length_792_cov_87.920592_g4217_i0~~NODE_4558_length_792_cov_87.920592_g4217_i0.p3  ORF type:complete len:177 (-),score=30.33 NODE_4558_length_792_cov_87.920592_g4217_i0:133-663(-)